MKKEDKLFVLINSLSKNEKRYFKIFAKLHSPPSEKNYIKLFNVIDKQKNYDEERIKKMFKYVNKKVHFPRLKNYLYGFIFKSMRVYHAETSQGHRIVNLLNDIELLYNKSLFDECLQFIERAKKIAIRYQFISELLVLVDWEIRLMSKLRSFERMNEVLRQGDDFLTTIQKNYQYYALYAQVMGHHHRYSRPRTETHLKRFQSVMEHPLMNDEKSAVSFDSQRTLFHTAYLSYYMAGNFNEAGNFLQKMERLYKTHPEQIEKRPEDYISVLINRMIILVDSCRLEKVPLMLENIRKTIEKYSVEDNNYSQTQLIRYYYGGKLNYYLQKGQFQEAMLLIPIIEGKMKLIGAFLGRESRVILYFNCALSFFLGGKSSKALYWINELLNESKNGMREDVTALGRILYLFIHFELGNTDLLEYLIKSTRLYLNKRGGIYSFEKTILQFMRTCCRIKDKLQVYNHLIKLKEDLAALSTDPFSVTAINILQLMPWLDKKIAGTISGK